MVPQVVGLIISLVLAAQAPGESMAGPCTTARHAYEALDLDAALQRAELGLHGDAGAQQCLEVRGLVLLALGRTEEATATLSTLFEVSPDYAVDARGLAPSTRNLIEGIREEVRPLEVRVRPRWILRETLMIDMGLQGGLRGAARVRYRLKLGPVGLETRSELPLIGASVTATVHVPSALHASTLELTGEVLDEVGRRVTTFSSQQVLQQRPAPERPASSPAAPPEVSASLPWWLWVVAGAVVVGGAVTAVVLVSPDTPDASGTLGGVGL